MWPTFYIPSVLSPGESFVDPEVSVKCGSFSGSGTPRVATIPNPDGIVNGQIQLVLVSYFTNGTPVWPDFATDGIWHDVFYGFRIVGPGGTWGIGRQRIFWRVYDSADPLFTITQPSGAINGVYLSMTLLNGHLEDPISGGLHCKNHFASFGPAIQGACQGLLPDNAGDLFFVQSGDGAGASAANEPDVPTDAEFACSGTASSGFSGHTTFGRTAGARQANNLLRHSGTLSSDAWSYVGMAVTAAPTNYSSTTRSRGFMQQMTGTTKHYVEQSVELEAGKTYLFAVRGFGQNGSANNNALWLTYEKPDLTEHGWGSRLANTTRATLSGSTEVDVSTLAGSPSYTHPVANSGTDYFGGTWSLLIHADQSGTYKLRIHLGRVDTDANTATAGLTSRDFYVVDTLLQEGPSVAQVPTFVTTTGAPLSEQSGALLAPWAVGSGDAHRHWNVLRFRRSGGRRRVNTLASLSSRGTRLDFSDFAINDTRFLDDPGSEGPEALTTSHVVYEFLPHKKYYCEVYVESYGTGSVATNYCIGVSPHETVQTGQTDQVGANLGEAAGQYVYRSIGTTRNNGGAGASVDQWQVGDYIGVGLDFTNEEVTFYRNGTLQATHAIADSQQLHTLWGGLFGAFGPATAADQARFVWNFRGPFGGRKPSGFVAWDFDNEIT